METAKIIDSVLDEMPAAAVPDEMPAAVPDEMPAALPDEIPAAVPDEVPAAVPDEAVIDDNNITLGTWDPSTKVKGDNGK